MIKRSSYPERRLLRKIEGLWTRVEGFLNRLTGTGGPAARPFNPMYHLGNLSIFLLIILATTGTYLTIFYRPGTDRAYETVAAISATWLGSLMRSIHLYASDGLALVIFLHALKIFVGDRFWGSRWLAWVSGVVVLVLIWSIGVMGYWLIWDQQAQWLTEYAINILAGAFAQSFITPDIAAQTFVFFVIVLFLHIFLSLLIIVGILVHVIRLSRVRLWSPRWLMVGTSVILTAMALWRPAPLTAQADLNRLVGTVFLDGWYLGFLPFVVRWGSPSIWGGTLLVLVIISALPWLVHGRTLGPARITVTETLCTGCTLCYLKCPYSAIDMRHRTDKSSRFELEAVVHPSLCTGCGLCAGTCATVGAELTGLPTDTLLARLRQSLASAAATGSSPIVIFTCERHLGLGSLAGTLPEQEPDVLALQPVLAQASFSTKNPGHKSVSVVTCPLPCVGMLQPEWVRQSLDDGAQAAFILSCPRDDCSYREGPYWLSGALSRRQALLRRGIYWLERAPGNPHEVTALLATIDQGEALTADRYLSETVKRKTPAKFSFLSLPKARAMATAFILLAVSLVLAPFVQWSGTATAVEQGHIRVAISHAGQFKGGTRAISSEVEAKLPPNIAAEQVLGGERFPVRLRIDVDGKQVLEQIYQPRGLRREGAIFGLEEWPLSPGNYNLDLWMMDDDETWQPVFTGPVEVEAGRVRTLIFDESQSSFVLY